MTSKKISQLDSGAPAQTTDQTVVARGNANYRLQVDQLMPGITYTAAATSAVARPVISKLGDIVSVKDFGAVGDGVTDDTAAIQAAVNSTNSKKTVFFPAGTYIIGASVLLLPSNTTLAGVGDASVLKLNPNINYVQGNVIMINSQAPGTTNLNLFNLYIDGSRDELGSGIGTQSPLITFYRVINFSVKNCTFYRAKGICFNLGQNTGFIQIENNKFLECGGKPDNSLGYRHQAIAFSGGSGYKVSGLTISNNYFFEQALDCISLADCNNVLVSGNICERSYSLLYTNPLGLYNDSGCSNLVVTNNIQRDCSEFGAGTTVPPNSIDLIEAYKVCISNNIFVNIDQIAVGLFAGCQDITVDSNVIVNASQAAVNSKSAIFSMVQNRFVCTNNTILTTSASAMSYGILVAASGVNQNISCNMINGAAIARIAIATGNPTQAINPLTPTAITSSTRISDLDISNNVDNVYGQFSINSGWQTWTPNVRAQTGTFTSVSVINNRYTKINNTITFNLNFGILNAGTGSGKIIFDLPQSTNYGVNGTGTESLTGNLINVFSESVSSARILGPGAASVIVSGNFYNVTATYPV